MLILIYNFEGERKHREEIAPLKGSRQPLERRPAWDFFFFFFVPSLKVAIQLCGKEKPGSFWKCEARLLPGVICRSD